MTSSHSFTVEVTMTAITTTLPQHLSSHLLSHVLLYLEAFDVERLSAVDPRASRLYEAILQQLQKIQEQPLEEETLETPKVFRFVADPDTLLARLNTRRLYQRLRRCRRSGEGPYQARPYASGKTTQQLALDEWRQIVRGTPNNDEKNNNNNNNSNNNNDAYMIPRPSALELLLFSPCPRAVTVLASYPRSGNSLLRNLFEQVTLRVTGSDMRGGLTAHDLVGEAAVQAARVQLVKTHYPERRGHGALPTARVVWLVRNPLDALHSYFHLLTTQSHTTSLTVRQQQAVATEFHRMARREIVVWQRFHQYWLAQAATVPVLLVRYEDLIRHPDKVMQRVVKFVLEVDDMRFFTQRIRQYCGTDDDNDNHRIESIGAYRPRAGGIGKSWNAYPDALRRELLQKVAPLLHQLGYAALLNQQGPPWSLPPIPGYALALKKHHGAQNKVLVLNKGPIVRTQELHTDWKVVRNIIRGALKQPAEKESSGEASVESSSSQETMPKRVTN